MKLNKFALFVIVALGGCQAVPMASTPRSIVFNGVSDLTIKDATEQAEAHCKKQGLHAQIISDNLADGRATFNCVN